MGRICCGLHSMNPCVSLQRSHDVSHDHFRKFREAYRSSVGAQVDVRAFEACLDSMRITNTKLVLCQFEEPHCS
jgi:hypothetical protein